MTLSGCKSQNVDAKGMDPSEVKVKEEPDVNVIQMDGANRFPLATVEQRPTSDELNATGAIAPDVNRTVPVISMTAGRVIDVHARLGDTVHKGQLLLRLNSPDIAAGIADYEKAQADNVLAKRQYDRAKLLYDRGAVAQKDVETAEDAEQKARADLAAAREKLRVLGTDPDHPSAIVELHAPVSGTIVEQNVTNAAGVKSLDNSPNLFTIADLSRVWVLCDVFENDLSKVHLGDSATLRLNAYPDRTYRARVSNIGSMLDPQTRSAKIRLEVDNTGGLMKPNMFATATFRSQGTKNHSVVPSTAVLRLHDKAWVFRPLNDRTYKREEIQAGSQFPDGSVEVLAGLAPGDRVVANALQFSSAVENK